MQIKICNLNVCIENIKNKNYKIKNCINDLSFSDLRNALNFNHKDEYKGVYIIWNKTKNKYYVGQSKNIFKRVFTQHFNKGMVKNYIFFKDWDNNDEFYWKYYICEIKDELDNLEKQKIAEYDSFRIGYNNTKGNL